MYDEAVFMHPHLGKKEVQRIVERPQLYLLAMSADTLADKLMYVDDRLADIQQLSLPIPVQGVTTPMHAVMRAFKSDNPEQQFETGVNQGGHYKCSACGVKTKSYRKLCTCFAAERLSISDRQKIATAGIKK